ncbi:MAG: Fe-S cluster assembly protein SufD [Actinobacteria bacterium]|nr:Fe-S cluster assembly protein SufD [Actinomycetota bacterium]
MSSLDTFVAPAADLPGPDWLRRRRRDAADRVRAAGLPSSEEEVWRYSPIDDLDLDAYAPAPPTAPTAPTAQQPVAHLDGRDGAGLLATEPAATVTIVDGVVAGIDVAERWKAAGLVVGRAADLDDGAALLGAAVGEHWEVITALNDAVAPDPIVVRVPRGVSVDAPVLVRHHVATAGCAAVPRLVVHVGESAAVAVVEHTTSAPGKALVVPLTEVVVEQAGRVAHVAVQELGPETWQLGSLIARVEREATFSSTTAGLGGGYARLRTDCRLTGRGATGVLDAVYFGEEDQTLDFRTFQDHAAPDTTSDLLYKGAVAGRSRSIYTGLIRVRPEGRGTNAVQTNRNIKLSDGAWAESVPNLEIETNDVRCAHASAVGPIDEEQRFYLESRGVPPAMAERLIVSGFFDEVLARLAVPAIAASLRARIAAKLDRQGIGT